jgi:hypothetical protein
MHLLNRKYVAVTFSNLYVRMGQSVIPVGPSRPHENDGLGRLVVSEIGPKVMEPGPSSSPGRPISNLSTRVQGQGYSVAGGADKPVQ